MLELQRRGIFVSCINHLGLFLSDREHLASKGKGLGVKQCFNLSRLMFLVL